MTSARIALRKYKFQQDVKLASHLKLLVGEEIRPSKFNNILNSYHNCIAAAAHDHFQSIKSGLAKKNEQQGDIRWRCLSRANAHTAYSLIKKSSKRGQFATSGDEIEGVNGTLWAIWWFRYAGHLLTGIAGYHFVVGDDPAPLKKGNTVRNGAVELVDHGKIGEFNDYQAHYRKMQDNLALEHMDDEFDDI